MMKTFRILFTGVGRRVELMQAFKQATNRMNVILKLYGADMAGTAPALAFCDYTRKVCGMRDADYIPQLLRICESDHIDLLIPTIDTDLLVLSQNAAKFDAKEQENRLRQRALQSASNFMSELIIKADIVDNRYLFF